MTKEGFERRGFKVDEQFEVDGKIFLVSGNMNMGKFSCKCITDHKTILTRGNLDTCYERIKNYKYMN